MNSVIFSSMIVNNEAMCYVNDVNGSIISNAELVNSINDHCVMHQEINCILRLNTAAIAFNIQVSSVALSIFIYEDLFSGVNIFSQTISLTHLDIVSDHLSPGAGAGSIPSASVEILPRH